MRQLVLLVCVATLLLIAGSVSAGNIIPTWESKSGQIGFYPISNEISYYRNYDDTGENRGQTLQIVAINGFKLLTDFNFEFTADPRPGTGPLCGIVAGETGDIVCQLKYPAGDLDFRAGADQPVRGAVRVLNCVISSEQM